MYKGKATGNIAAACKQDANHPCWDCGQTGHWLGDPQCSKHGAGLFLPPGKKKAKQVKLVEHATEVTGFVPDDMNRENPAAHEVQMAEVSCPPMLLEEAIDSSHEVQLSFRWCSTHVRQAVGRCFGFSLQQSLHWHFMACWLLDCVACGPQLHSVAGPLHFGERDLQVWQRRHPDLHQALATSSHGGSDFDLHLGVCGGSAVIGFATWKRFLGWDWSSFEFCTKAASSRSPLRFTHPTSAAHGRSLCPSTHPFEMAEAGF